MSRGGGGLDWLTIQCIALARGLILVHYNQETTNILAPPIANPATTHVQLPPPQHIEPKEHHGAMECNNLAFFKARIQVVQI
jgi:hypothetical protein